MSSLQALAEIIANGVASIESTCAANDQSYPSLDTSYTVESANIQSQYIPQAAPVIAAAYQVIATLTHPSTYLFNWAAAVSFLTLYPQSLWLTLSPKSHLSASLAVVNEGYVPDLLREAGPKASRRSRQLWTCA